MRTSLQLLKQYFGYDSFRPQQEQIIEAVLSNKDVLVLMPTGGGKSICFQIPALLKDGITLVISPLIALMKDQVEALKANGIEADFINSSQSFVEEREIIEKCYAGKIKLLYLSPEKVLLLAQGLLKQLKLSLIAIDEAHCISQWGHDFRPEYAQLKILKELFPGTPTIALTATADKVTRKDIIAQLELNDPSVFISSFDRPNLHLSVRSNLKEKEKMEEILSFIRSQPDQSGIIYCLSRKGTEKVCAQLIANGIKAAFYHAGMDSAARSKVQEQFIFDEIKIICATIAFGMGIDKSNVRWIMHYNLPKNIEGYYQEIGRSGRDGAPAKAILYYNISDLIKLSDFASKSGQAELNQEKLKRMQQFAEARVCRRKILLSYFGENYEQRCNSCDVCSNPPEYMDGTVIAQKAISALIRAGERIGINLLIDILRGSLNAEIKSNGFDKLKTHGAGREYSQATWQSYILQLLQTGVFEMAYDEGFALKVTDYGKLLVRSNQKIELAAPVLKPARERFQASYEPEGEMLDLLKELKLLRKKIAEIEGMPPYIIFNDFSLIQMVEKLPTSKHEMLGISGVSKNKYERFGHLFENKIMELAGHLKPVDTTLNDILSGENIQKYIDELKKYSTKITHTTIGKLLTGNDRDIPDELRQISFYGLLRNKSGYKMVAPVLKKYFVDNHIETGTPQEILASEYFSKEIKNELGDDEIDEAKIAVSQFPINRPSETIDNDYILNIRKEFPRAYEYWNDEETELLVRLCNKTNDLDLLASILQRNPGSLKMQFKKLTAGHRPMTAGH